MLSYKLNKYFCYACYGIKYFNTLLLVIHMIEIEWLKFLIGFVNYVDIVSGLALSHITPMKCNFTFHRLTV